MTEEEALFGIIAGVPNLEPQGVSHMLKALGPLPLLDDVACTGEDGQAQRGMLELRMFFKLGVAMARAIAITITRFV